MITNEETISVLNDLIQVFKDGEREFRDCAEKVTDPELLNFFTKTSQRCTVRRHDVTKRDKPPGGGEPKTEDSFSGAAHRMWSNLKTAVEGG